MAGHHIGLNYPGTAAYSYGHGEQSNRAGPEPRATGLGRVAARRETAMQVEPASPQK